MPLYEGTTLGADKLSVVFEFGHAFTRCGFVSEHSPRVILRSETKDGTNLFDIRGDRELFLALQEFIENLYFRFLAVNPKDRKVIIVESLFSPRRFRSTLAKVFFNHFDVPAICFLPSHLTSLMTLLIPTGLVVDVGYTESSVIPVIEGVTLLESTCFSSAAANAVHERVRQELLDNMAEISEDGGDYKFKPEVIQSLPEKTLEDIKVRACFIPSFERGQELVEKKRTGQSIGKQPPKDVEYPLEGKVILNIPGSVRESGCQALFELQGHESSVASMILNCILLSPLDSRRSLASNIVLTGGTVMTTGFKKRIRKELESLVTKNPSFKDKFAFKEFSFHSLPCHPNYAAWLGGAIFGGTDAVTSKLITKNTFLQSRGSDLSDWTTWLPAV